MILVVEATIKTFFQQVILLLCIQQCQKKKEKQINNQKFFTIVGYHYCKVDRYIFAILIPLN